MKKVLFIAIVGILSISLIGCANNFKAKDTLSNKDNQNLSNDNILDEKVAIEDATNIDIEICAAQVKVESYDGDNIKIAGKLSENSKGLYINKNGDTLEVIEKGYEAFKSFVNFGDNKSKIDILIPSTFKGNLIFKQGAGTSQIKGLNVKNLDISGGAGELKCSDIIFDTLNLNCGVGKVDLNLNKKCGDIIVIGGVGETNIKMAEVGGNLIYNGGVGETNITIPVNSPVKFITQKGLGKCKIDAQTSSAGTYTFNLKVGVGAIIVEN